MFNPWIKENVEWSFQITRLIGEASQGGGEAHELLRIVNQMRLGNSEDWHDSFFKLAEETENLAIESISGGHKVTARSHYLRACNYFRASELLLEPGDPRKNEMFRRSIACFEKAAVLFNPPIEKINITFEGDSLTGYFATPWEGGSKSNPVVFYIAGADVYKEALFFLGGTEALRRGLALIVVDGPGQGETLRLKGIPSRFDYERPVSVILDYLQSRPEVDPERIAIVGRSFGGYYAARAVAFEKRVKACVLFSALYDALEFYDSYSRVSARRQRHMHWLVGANSENEARQKLAKFNLHKVVDKITCPTLIIHSEDDFFVPVSHAHRVFEEISGPKELKVIKSGEPGSVHCQYDLFPQILPYIFDWIKDRL